jgi:hypothetical protein
MSKFGDMIMALPHKDDNGITTKRLYWMHTPPTKAGWYWAAHDRGIMIEDVYEYEGKMCIEHRDIGAQPVEESGYTLWLGPILMPINFND